VLLCRPKPEVEGKEEEEEQAGILQMIDRLEQAVDSLRQR
jgi:hypothetical protein